LKLFFFASNLFLNPERACFMCIINDELGASHLNETACGEKERENKGLKYGEEVKG
jgi:hypothetical protein